MQRLKILFLGDASNYHSCLADALRRMGHKVTVVSNGSTWMNTRRDINLTRHPGKWGTAKYLLDVFMLLSQLRGYDIVHLINPAFFMELHLNRLRYIFDYLRRHNKHVFLSATTSDYYYAHVCQDCTTFRYSDYFVGDKPSPYYLSGGEADLKQWEAPLHKGYTMYFTPRLDGVVACLYEYYKSYEGAVAPGRLVYGGIPIDVKSIEPHFIAEPPKKVKFFLGQKSGRIELKGSDLLLDALRRTCDRYPGQCEMQVVENRPYQEYIELLSASHVNLDQLYSYTPATNALIGMAQGVVAVSGAEPEFYDFIGEHECQPIINVSPLVEGDIDAKLAWIVEHRDQLPLLSRQSREFVVKHNDSHIGAQRHIDFWNKVINKMQ